MSLIACHAGQTKSTKSRGKISAAMFLTENIDGGAKRSVQSSIIDKHLSHCECCSAWHISFKSLVSIVFS